LLLLRLALILWGAGAAGEKWFNNSSSSVGSGSAGRRAFRNKTLSLSRLWLLLAAARSWPCCFGRSKSGEWTQQF
jgi:hypothetical protein